MIRYKNIIAYTKNIDQSSHKYQTERLTHQIYANKAREQGAIISIRLNVKETLPRRAPGASARTHPTTKGSVMKGIQGKRILFCRH